MSEHNIDATAEEVGSEVAVVEQPPTNLFRTDDPVEVVERAGKVADALKGVLVRQGLTANIQGREHVRVEGWTTLGSMLGVVPVCVWTRKLENGWEARVEARTLDGRVVGAAEAECLTTELLWKSRDDYALRSMAQTRATSKALRGPLGFIVTLAGYQAIPAEEMPTAVVDPGPPMELTPTGPQLKYLKTLVTQSGAPQRTLRAMLDQVGASNVQIEAGWAGKLTRGQASGLIELFKKGSLPDPEAHDIPTNFDA